jgi:serine/threonine protein kinase
VSTDPKAAASDDRIGNYRYVRTLLSGQNSTVMEVVQDGSGRRFAMKQLLSNKAKDPEERKAFELEAKIGMHLQHPNLVHVYEYVKDKNAPYFVMDYFPSTHMRLVMAKAPLFAEFKPKLHRIMMQTATGLAYMHDKGWIHRDVKPENVIVNKSAEVRVIDYSLSLKLHSGLSKMFAGKPPRQGTHSYMSPEQIRRQPASIASDIYSFGCVCYEFACRRPPFRANSPNDLLQKHISEQPNPPTSHENSITPEFSDLVMRMIKKKAADRPKNFQELMSLLSRIKVFKDDPNPVSGQGMY